MYILTRPITSQGKKYRSYFEKKLNLFAGVQSTFVPEKAKSFESREEAKFFIRKYLKGLRYKCTLLANEIVKYQNQSK